jgi:RecG-like helicase
MNLRIADLQRHQDLLGMVTKAGKIMVAEYPEECQKLIQRWVKAEGLHYGEV